MWINCNECIYFQEDDCDEFECRDGCNFGITEEEYNFLLEMIMKEVEDDVQNLY